MSNKRILILSDGLPGHYKKTRAVAKIVQQRYPADVQWMTVKLRVGIYRRVLRLILNQRQQPPHPDWLRMFYSISDPLPETPDLIISSGGKTSYLSAWLGAHYGCPSVFIGQTRKIRKSYFTRIVASELDYLADGRHIKSLPATEVDADLVAEAAAEYLPSTGLAQRPRWTLVTGGNGAGYAYRPSDWTQLCDAARSRAEQHDIRWLVTTSRRTDPFAEDLFSGPRMRECADDVLVYNRDQRVVYNAFLGLASVIVCTEDSGKMLTECVASGRPVLAVRPARSRTARHVKALVQRFESAGYLKRMTIPELRTESIEEFVRAHQPPPEPLMKRVREEVTEFVGTLPWAA